MAFRTSSSGSRTFRNVESGSVYNDNMDQQPWGQHFYYILSQVRSNEILEREMRGSRSHDTFPTNIFKNYQHIARYGTTWRWEAAAYRQKVRQTPRCSSGRRELENAPFPVSRCCRYLPLTDCRWAAHSYARLNSWTLCSLKWPLINNSSL